jgi:hypothetical protein
MMKKALAFFLSLFALTSCQPQAPPTNTVAEDASVTYEVDTSEPPDGSLDDGEPADTAFFDRPAAWRNQHAQSAATTRATLTICYMNNETEIFRPATYAVRLWWFSSEPSLTDWHDGSAVANRYDKPTFRVTKTATTRSYTRKTIYSGWYIAEANESGIYYKFWVPANSNGLFITNENAPSNASYSGFYARFGKIKVSLWNGKIAKPDDVHVTFSKGLADTQFWLYAEDGTGTSKGMFWFMPIGNYMVSAWANKPGGLGQWTTGEIPVTITDGKLYPSIKFQFK